MYAYPPLECSVQPPKLLLYANVQTQVEGGSVKELATVCCALPSNRGLAVVPPMVLVIARSLLLPSPMIR